MIPPPSLIWSPEVIIWIVFETKWLKRGTRSRGVWNYTRHPLRLIVTRQFQRSFNSQGPALSIESSRPAIATDVGLTPQGIHWRLVHPVKLQKRQASRGPSYKRDMYVMGWTVSAVAHRILGDGNIVGLIVTAQGPGGEGLIVIHSVGAEWLLLYLQSTWLECSQYKLAVQLYEDFSEQLYEDFSELAEKLLQPLSEQSDGFYSWWAGKRTVKKASRARV